MATAQISADPVKRAAANPKLELLERLGYIVRGALYTVMGVLALRIALRIGGGKATDLQGSLVFLVGNPFGKLVLILAIIGLAGYSLWGLIRAVYDPLHRGRDAEGLAARVGFVTSALAYAAIALFALQMLAGAGTAATGDSTQKAVSGLLAQPLGGWLTIGLGVIAMGVAALATHAISRRGRLIKYPKI